jgi:hypothetical protein
MPVHAALGRLYGYDALAQQVQPRATVFGGRLYAPQAYLARLPLQALLYVIRQRVGVVRKLVFLRAHLLRHEPANGLPQHPVFLGQFPASVRVHPAHCRKRLT